MSTVNRSVGLGWAEIADEGQYNLALTLAKGNYQRNLLNGYESQSGSTLRGRAKAYSSTYWRSRKALLARLTAGGIEWHVGTREKGRKVLVIGAYAEEAKP